MGHKLTGTEEEYPGMGFLDRPTIGTSSPAKPRDFLTGGNILWGMKILEIKKDLNHVA
jgi:hypothetical protein